MRHISLAAALLSMLLVLPRMTRADIVYDIQDYPADQVTHHISGTITTDGTTGPYIDRTHIVSWVVTFDGTLTFHSTDPSSYTKGIYEIGNLDVGLTNITVGTGAFLGLLSEPASLIDAVEWSRSPGVEPVPYSAQYNSSTLWTNSSPSFGGTDPWVIAVAESSAVPEPSTAIVAVFGTVAFIAYGWSRHRRAQRRQAAA